MFRAEIWNKQEGFKIPDGTFFDIDRIFREYPFTKDGVIVIERMPNGNVGAIDDLLNLRSIYNIDPALDDNAALQKYIEIRNTPPAPIVDPTAAKIDYLIMMTE